MPNRVRFGPSANVGVGYALLPQFGFILKRRNWPKTLGRDGARTPMPWNADKPFAGFSTTEPWLPIDPNHTRCAADRQEQDPKSVLNFARDILKLRMGSTALRIGDMQFLNAPKEICAFIRVSNDEKFLCVFNPSQTTQRFVPAAVDQWRIVASAIIDGPVSNNSSAVPETIAPVSGYIARRC